MASGPRIVVVVNPRSQNGALGRKWSFIAAVLRRELGAFEDVLTRKPGDATRLAREAIDSGADIVVAIGGDGTINEVANGFFENGAPIETKAALGVLPFGTGGDFRKTLRITKEIERAARVLKHGTRKAIDVGRLDFTTDSGGTGTRIFVNIASFGISGLVDQYVNTTTKALGGMASFAIATVRATLTYQNQRVRLVFDDNAGTAVERAVNSVAVANGRYFGGGMKIAPMAEIDDGLFEVVTIGDMPKLDMALNAPKIYNGTHIGSPGVYHRSAAKVRAEPLGNDDVRIDCDGETPGKLPATFTLLPGALSLMVPA